MAAVTPTFPRSGAGKRQPNVLLILTDEWRGQALGSAGDVNAHTPHIDALADESLTFEQAIAGTPVCCPSRASLLTGQYPLTHGVYINDVPLKPTGMTLAEAFAGAGYDTAYIGKWHLFGSPEGRYERRESYIPEDARLGFQYWKAAECTHEYNRSSYYAGNDQAKRYWEGYDAIAQTADACSYMRERPAERPFFLTLSYGPPHFPLDSAPEEYAALYRDRPLELRPNVPEGRREDALRDLRGYYAHIAAVDECVGRLLATVDEAGLAESTIVIFTSDHGAMLGSQGLEHKLTPWEESIRVPLLVRRPGMTTPASTDILLNTPDLMPTLLGLAGIAVPAGVEGVDVLAPGTPRPTSAFLSVPVSFSSLRHDGFSEYRGVRDARYTYVRSHSGPWLLYDNKNDAHQMRNLCDDPAARPVRDHLERELTSFLESLDDEFLPSRDYLERDGLTHYFEVNTRQGHVGSPWGDWESTLPGEESGWSVNVTPLQAIMADPVARDIVAEELPDLLHLDELERCLPATLVVLNAFMPELVTTEGVAAVAARLSELGTHGHAESP
ncbi:sulfatase [Streptomyces sp. NPDC090075]|uniref:sulfatase family protein n=1 Tax=Streptomyces sp. NPDC090075 TaxID=3365937 RepID=UPI00382FA1DE